MSDQPRAELAALLRARLPEHWRIVADLREGDDTWATSLDLQLKTVRRVATVGGTMHELGYQATLRVPGENLRRAEDVLDDELLEFAVTLDDLGIGWDVFTKAVYDQRLGYQTTLTLYAERTT